MVQICLIDVRCLQDPPYSERGIGRHTRSLLEHARAGLPGVKLVGVTDLALPPLPESTRALLDTTRCSAYTGALEGPTRFVQFSPMTHDPLFTARLLHNPLIPAATVVYDFIPLEEPGRYLSAPGPRLDYHLSLRWLARYDLFLPISTDAATRLRTLLVVPEKRIVITGAPLAPGFERVVPQSPRHVLVIGGPDPRKNPESVVRAHARTAWLQSHAVPLVITGAYSAEWLASARAMAASLGGDPALVEGPGHVDEATLQDLYAGAFCVVTPSRAEGFSLPVIEAMAAGVPALASDIPAHRELLQAALFPLDDDLFLGALLDQVQDPAWRDAALARQESVWPRFRSEAVATRFWTAIGRLAPSVAPSIPPARDRVRGRARVALLTPLPPDRSGVADYSAATCVELGKLVELHVFTPTLGVGAVENVASINPLSAIPLVSSDFDRVVGVLGNSVFHLGILELLLRYGGAAVLHDGRLTDLYAGHIEPDRTQHLAEIEMARPMRPGELSEWLVGDRAPAALLLAEIVAAAEPLMMHARAGVEAVGRRYGRKAIRLPFSLYRDFADQSLSEPARQAARARLGIRTDQVMLTSFGTVHPAKAPLDCIWSLSLLRDWSLDARLDFVGAPMMPVEPLWTLAASLGVERFVRIGDAFVGEDVYRDYLVGADIGIQLRTTGAGNLSGALSDCIAAGLPTVASAGLMDGLDLPDYVRAVPDHPSPVLVAEAAMALRGRRADRQARRDYAERHGFDSYAAQLCMALGLG